MSLEIIESTDTLTHVALSGQLTALGVEQISGEVHEHIVGPGVNTIIDLSGSRFIASMGISLLLDCRRLLAKSGAKLVLLNPMPKVEDTLRAARMDKLFPITHSLEEAKEALAAD